MLKYGYAPQAVVVAAGDVAASAKLAKMTMATGNGAATATPATATGDDGKGPSGFKEVPY